MASNGNQSSKVFFITGISTGFGRSIVEHALDAGHYVIGTTRNGTVPYEKHSNLTVLPLSFKDLNDVKSIVKKAHSIYNRIDVVINNVGYGIDGAIEEYSVEQAKELFDVNVWGVVSVIQAVLPYLRQQGSGHIINISSVSGVVSAGGTSLYSSSKFAIEAISEALAQEVKEFGIYVSIVQPGPFVTSFTSNGGQVDQPLEIYGKYHNITEQFQKQYANGDVKKVGEIMLHIVNNVTTLPLRIPLGSIALYGITQKLTGQLDDLKKIESLAQSTDLPISTTNASTAPLPATATTTTLAV